MGPLTLKYPLVNYFISTMFVTVVDMEKKSMVRIIYGIAVLIIIASMVFPTWTLVIKDSSSTITTDFSSIGLHTNENDNGAETATGYYFMDIPDIFKPIMVVFVMAIITILLLVVNFLIMERRERISGRPKNGILVIAVFILSIATPSFFAYVWSKYLTTALDSLFDGSLWGSRVDNGTTYTFGPNIGFFLMIAAICLIFAGMLLTRRDAREERAKET